jgi:hypothetical protein
LVQGPQEERARGTQAWRSRTDDARPEGSFDGALNCAFAQTLSDGRLSVRHRILTTDPGPMQKDADKKAMEEKAAAKAAAGSK